MWNLWNAFRKNEESKYNDEKLNEVIKKMKSYNNLHKFKSQVVLDYLLSAYKSTDTVEELFNTIYLSKDKLGQVDDLLEAVNMKYPLENQQFEHYRNKKIYTLEGVAMPVENFCNGESITVFHTELEKEFPVYIFHSLFFHNFTDEHLVIYHNSENQIFARPYELFFGLVEEHNLVKPRFKKI